jgi:hypothetical protein
MPAPIIGAAAAAAARLVAKKIASRAVGGITGTGAKNVNPVYKEMISSKAKKQAAAYAAGAGATAAWVGTQAAISAANPKTKTIKKNK